MIRRLYVDNYKCLVNFEISFGEQALLLGPNGSGKSSVLDVILALRQVLSGSVDLTDPKIFPPRTLTRWEERRLQTFEVDVELQEGPFRYRFEVEHKIEPRKARIRLERLEDASGPLFVFENGEVQLYRDNHSKGPAFPADWSMSKIATVPPRGDNTRLTSFLDFMRRIVVCGPYPSGFASESLTEDRVLARDGSNFVAWYRHMSQEHQELVPAYHNTLTKVLDGFKGIRLEKVGLDARAFIAMFEEGMVRYELKLDELSDGHRALVALYALVLTTIRRGYTLLLDEPDNYVALPELQPWLFFLKDSLDEKGGQAILCSHHPELIDYLGADTGIWLNRDAGGPTKVTRLSAPSEGSLRLSELIARGWQP